MRVERTAAAGIRAAGAVLVVAAGLLVSGCGLLPSPSLPPVPSATTPPTGETGQAEQCAQLLTDVQGIAADVARVGEMFGNADFLGAAALIGSISGRVADLQTRVTDPALLERIDEIQTGWDALVEDVQGSINSLDAAGIDRAVAGLTQLGEQVTALQEFCAGTA